MVVPSAGCEEDSEEEAVEDEEETAELEDLSSDYVLSRFLSGHSPAVEILLSLPELEKEEMAGALRDLGQRVVLDCGDCLDSGGEFLVVLFVYWDFDYVSIFHFRH